MNDEELRTLIIEDFERLSSISVEEQLLLGKWSELNNKTFTKQELQHIWELKKSIWIPKEPTDYINLQPKVKLVSTKQSQNTWRLLRYFCTTMPYTPHVGRCLKFLIIDNITKTYLGFICIASDLISIVGRDKYIGWNAEIKNEHKMLGHTCVGSVIVPLQPLGYNYAGGKLISLMVCSDVVENAWNEKYPQKLAGITTTSLYGGFSQYNNLKYWHKCLTTEGNISMFPSVNVYEKIREWVKKNHPDDYTKMRNNRTNPKWKVLETAYKYLKIKPPSTNAPRGVYFCRLYKNTNEFLRMEHNELGDKLFDNSVNTLSNLWKEKYAKKRVNNLLKNDKYNTNILFYDDLIGISFEEAKEKYINSVGR